MTKRAAATCAALLLAALALADCRTAPGERSRADAGRARPPAPSSPEALRAAVEKLRRLHTPLGPPQPGDWLETFKEPGQTFEEYLKSNPTRPEGVRRVLYVQPLGSFTPAQTRVVGLTADYMSRFFGLPVRVLDPARLGKVPGKALRDSPVGSGKQIQAGYIMMEVLRPKLPPDAAALIGFTSSDLFPDETMNYVFGQASLDARVGVWSLYWLGRPDASEADFKFTLLRTLKIAAHETGHMFSLAHCTKYECVMNGTNSLNESDRHPLDACAECAAKLCWAAGADPRERYARLAAFCADHDLPYERRFFEDSARALE
ncbi:MAG TPA: archaemetzincin [Pyrinomonadaceae bacterium]|jgi:archaemetzincin